jgi:outer membrane protein assembly factor BamB
MLIIKRIRICLSNNRALLPIRPPRPDNPWALAAAIIFLLQVSSACASDWPQFLGPARNGRSTETGLLATWPVAGPPVVWERQVGAGYSGPVISGQRLILFHQVGKEEVIECRDAATGNGLWKSAYASNYVDDYGKGDGPRSTPLIADKQVFTLGPEGDWRCFDHETGKTLWKRSLHEDYPVKKNFFGVGTSPILEGEKLLINVGAKNAGVVAFARNTGKELWKATDHQASYSSPVAASIAGKRQVFFFTREGLVALDPASGAVVFSKPWRARMAASVNAATPLVINNQVFISASYNTGALLLRWGDGGVEEIWKRDDIMSNHYATCIHHNGYLYGFDGRQEERARFRCVELETGKIRWTKEGFGCGSMILAEGRLIILNEDGDLVLVEAAPEAYQEKARANVLSKPCRAQIALSEGRLYGRDPRKIICWNLKK